MSYALIHSSYGIRNAYTEFQCNTRQPIVFILGNFAQFAMLAFHQEILPQLFSVLS